MILVIPPQGLLANRTSLATRYYSSTQKQRIHVHRIQTEVYYALEGEALLYVNGEEQLVKPGDACIIEPGDYHRYSNISDTGFKQVVFKIDMPEDTDDTEWLE